MGLIALAAYLTAPDGFELGGETLKNWVSARIFRQTGGFPVFHHGLLYNLYLQIFLSLDYPLSAQLEHAITHLFAYGSLLFLLRRHLPNWAALALLCAWIPALWTVEGEARILAMGLFSLYLALDKDNPWNRGFVPVPLLAAALTDGLFVPFLGGHAIGCVLFRDRRPAARAPLLVKAALAVLLAISSAFQSRRPDHNVHAFEYPWSPVPLEEVLGAASLQVANWKWVVSRYPESERLDKDWYLTHDEAFGGAKSIGEALRNNPGVYLRNLLAEFRVVLGSPRYFLIGFREPPPWARLPLKLIVLPLLSLCAYWLLRACRRRDELPKFFSLAVGAAGAAAAYSLVYISPRYQLPLLPLGLLLVVQLGAALRSLAAFQFERMPYPEKPSALTLALVLASALSAWTAAPPYEPAPRDRGFLARNPFELRGRLWRVRDPLMASLGRGKRILALEEAWIRSFADVDIEKVYHPLYLPPFKDDKDGSAERFLETLDVIWVSEAFSRRVPNIATQLYLRYELHVEPFLTRAVSEGWTREELPGFGRIYRRPAG